MEHCFKHKLDKPHRFIAQYELVKDFLNSSLEMKGNNPTEKSSIEGDGYKEKETQQVVENDLPQVSNAEAKHSFEDFQLRNITSLINKCHIDDDGKDIPDKFENITITSSEYNTLLYVRTRLKSLI